MNFELNQPVSLDITPKAKAVWNTLGTEYPKSFPALKELVDNSISAAKLNGDKCSLIVSIEEITDMDYKISVEDNSGGVSDPNVLLTIATSSQDKEGLYNVYGYGLKNAIAYFQPKYEKSQWLIQSKTHDNIENDVILEVNAPYVFNNEYNESYNHKGMNVVYSNINRYKGAFSSPSTYIEFITPKNRFINLNPLKSGGRNSSILSSVVSELSNLFSLFYRPLLNNHSLEISIKYKENNGKRKFNETKVIGYDLPITEKLGVVSNKSVTTDGGKLKINATWFTIDRKGNSPYVYSQKNGMLLYVNGILVEPYKWENNVFGGGVWHPSVNSLACYVEVEGSKNSTPELSVSKTKIQETGNNYQMLIAELTSNCPTNEILILRNAANTENETVKRDRRVDIVYRENQRNGFITNLEKERVLKLPDGSKGNENLRIDVFYEIPTQNKICVEEWKKDIINTNAIGQAINYYNLLKMEYPNSVIELTMVSGKLKSSAESLINMYNNMGYNIQFKSFADYGIV